MDDSEKLKEIKKYLKDTIRELCDMATDPQYSSYEQDLWAARAEGLEICYLAFF